MRRGNIVEILYHPAFISLIIWIVLLLLIPLSVSRYRIKPVYEDIYPPNVYFLYCDLDSDGTSERISIDLNDPGQSKIIVYKDDKVMDQYDVAYHPSSSQPVFFGDFNSDTCKEIYIFTLNDTSLYLSIIDPIAQHKAIVYNRYVDAWEISPQSTNQPQFVPVGITFNSDRQSKDLIFYVTSGYCLQPRNLYRYIIADDSLIKSPESYATIYQCILLEKSGPASENTFLLSTQATGNIDETTPYSDQHAWLMALDEEMKFCFKPVKLGQNPSNLHAIPIIMRGNTMFLTLYDYFGIEDIKSMFYIFDKHGNKIKEKEVKDYEPTFSNIFPTEDQDGKSFYLIKNHNTVVEKIDTSFNTVQTYNMPPIAQEKPFACLDANLDGSDEFFFLGREQKSIVVCSNNFRDAIEYEFNSEISQSIVSPVLTRGSKPLVHLQMETHGWFFSYDKNPLYYLRVPLYLVSYLIIYLFIGLIYRLQRYRLGLKTATEREIASLQMKAIKSQLDPHFTLNVLNSIGSLYQNESNRQKADYIFSKYATLIRQTVISSDKIIIALDEEIDFVGNYLDVEQFRFGKTFDYSIDIDEAVDMEMRIPRMLIHTFVENSIKYGLRKRTDGGKLKIEIKKNRGMVVITIEDNGPGLKTDATTPGGTGKGLKIIDELTGLYYRLEKIRITTSLDNITDQKGEILGTRATITLPNP